MNANRNRSLLLVGLLVFAVVGATVPAMAGPATDAGQATTTTDQLVVDDDGNGAFETIQAALDAADDGDTVRVRPGTYDERLTVDVAVRLVAPRGATLDGRDLDGGTAIDITDNASAVVEGFTVVGYTVGVAATGAWSDADWVLRNTTLRDIGFMGVTAAGDGDWELRNVTIRNTGTGISASSADGDWRVLDTVIHNATEGSGIDAKGTEGDWELRNVTVSDADFVGVDASHTWGDWRIVNSTIRNVSVGVAAYQASGNWTVVGSTLANATTDRPYDIMMPPLTEGVAIDATRANGSWSVHRTRFVGNDEGGVLADGAAPAGNATRNYWGGDGISADDCAGRVDCSNALRSWPPSAETQPVTPTDPTTTPETPTRAGPNSPTGDDTGTPSQNGAGPSTATRAPFAPWLAAVALATVALRFRYRG